MDEKSIRIHMEFLMANMDNVGWDCRGIFWDNSWRYAWWNMQHGFGFTPKRAWDLQMFWGAIIVHGLLCALIHKVGSLIMTSYTRLKAHDHCILRSLIGQKSRDHLTSLHTRRWKPKDPNKLSSMKSLHGFLHGNFIYLLIFECFKVCRGFALGLPPRIRHYANSGIPCHSQGP
jgi:hypothetical protein